MSAERLDRSATRAADGHPPSFLLDAFHVGETSREVTDHLPGCDRCRAYLAELDDAKDAFLVRRDPAAFVRELRAQADTRTSSWWRWRPRLAVPAVVIAGTVAVVLVMRPAAERASSTVAADDDLRAKGPVGASVIRDRAGVQSRHAGTLAVRPGDRLRVELTVPSHRRLAAGVLASDGAWLPLLAPVDAAIGVTVLPSFAIDSAPTAGRLIYGAPESIARVRRGESAPDVGVVEMTWDAPGR